jgi:hypothetical protein
MFKGSATEAMSLKQDVDFAGAPLNAFDQLILTAYIDAGVGEKLKGVLKVKYSDAPTTKVTLKAAPSFGYDLVVGIPAILTTDNVTAIIVSFKHSSPKGKLFLDDVALRLRQGDVPVPREPIQLPGPEIPADWRG